MCQTLDSHVLIVYWCVQHLTAVTLFWLMNALYDEMWQFHDRLACMNDPYIIITSSCVTLTKVYLITFRWIHLRDECRYGFSCHICAIHVLQILNATKTSHHKSTIQHEINKLIYIKFINWFEGIGRNTYFISSFPDIEFCFFHLKISLLLQVIEFSLLSFLSAKKSQFIFIWQSIFIQ